MRANVEKMKVSVTPSNNLILHILSEKGRTFEFLMGGHNAGILAERFGLIASKLKGWLSFNTTGPARTTTEQVDSPISTSEPFDEVKDGFQVGVSEDRRFVLVRFHSPASPEASGIDLDLALPAQDAGVLIAALQTSYALLDGSTKPTAH